MAFIILIGDMSIVHLMQDPLWISRFSSAEMRVYGSTDDQSPRLRVDPATVCGAALWPGCWRILARLLSQTPVSKSPYPPCKARESVSFRSETAIRPICSARRPFCSACRAFDRVRRALSSACRAIRVACRAKSSARRALNTPSRAFDTLSRANSSARRANRAACRAKRAEWQIPAKSAPPFAPESAP